MSDPKLFMMTMRAVGNLARNDENIATLVGAGVCSSVLEGVQRNNKDKEVVELVASVLSNLASIDSAAISLEDGLQALRQGQTMRKEAAAPPAPGKFTPPPPPTAAPSLPVPVVAEDGLTLTDHVTQVFVEDGGAKGLLACIKAFPTQPTIVAASLRALSYICDTDSVLERLATESDLVRYRSHYTLL